MPADASLLLPLPSHCRRVLRRQLERHLQWPRSPAIRPPDRSGRCHLGSTMFTFLGYVAGPSLFALALPAFGWSVAVAAVGVQIIAMGVLQTRHPRPPGRDRSEVS